LRNFRGVKEGSIVLPKHAVLLGANNAGKSTIVEALALLFGREKMVRPLSDWDFFGGRPTTDSRFYIIGTVTDFPGNDPSAAPDWFIVDNAAQPVWWHDQTTTLSPDVDPPAGTLLATQLAFAARYDEETCEFEKVRYFYYGESDPFTDGYAPTPSRLLRDIGLFLLSSNREWDKLLSFGSSSLLKVIRENDALPGKVIEQIKQQLRSDVSKIEDASPRVVSRKVSIEADQANRARQLEALGFHAFDAFHVACAESGQVDVMLTTDDKLLRVARRLKDILQVRVANPLQWLEETL
jgi:putative ATP-dependent endonuclease of OLD family